jgi:hypothetical protein
MADPTVRKFNWNAEREPALGLRLEPELTEQLRVIAQKHRRADLNGPVPPQGLGALFIADSPLTELSPPAKPGYQYHLRR